MALPRMDSVTYSLKLPSTAEELKYRPFTVKEQKALLIANESEDVDTIQNAKARNLLVGCSVHDLDVSPSYLISLVIEYLPWQFS